MDDLLDEVLSLQASWTAQNTPQMQRRGVIVRQELAALLRAHSGELANAVGIPEPDLGVQGKDGTGLKTEVPWTRVFSRKRSPSATVGWYIVYLFSATGDRVYLSLNQGTTVWKGGEFVPREPQELKERVEWARPLIDAKLGRMREDLIQHIHLNAAKSHLGPGYEAGNVVSIEYEKGNIPNRDVLMKDIIFMAGLLSALYQAEESGAYVPGDLAPEIAQAQEAAAITAGRRSLRPKGQGFRLTVEEKQAVELHGMRMATEHFRKQGWVIRDVSGKESFDLLLTRGSERLHVEVKGTTSMGAQVVLTRAEVEKQRQVAPANALVIVHSISLNRAVSPPETSGGILHCVSPWNISDDDLVVVSYFYRTGL